MYFLQKDDIMLHFTPKSKLSKTVHNKKGLIKLYFDIES